MKLRNRLLITIMTFALLLTSLTPANVMAASTKKMYVVTSQTSRNVTTKIKYKNGLITKLSYSDGSESETYKYDKNGKLIAWSDAVDSKDTKALSHDSKGRVTEVNYNYGGVYRYSYNKSGKIKKTTEPNTGWKETYSYKNNRLTKIKATNYSYTNIKYDKHGTIKSFTYTSTDESGKSTLYYKVKNTYKKGLLIKAVIKAKYKGDKQYETVNTLKFKYKKITVPAKLAAKAKAQQNYFRQTVTPSLVTLNK